MAAQVAPQPVEPPDDKSIPAAPEGMSPGRASPARLLAFIPHGQRHADL